MPRRGDEANRLGNEYESLWIADSLLDILLGEAATLLVAAFGSEGQGIDIIKRGSDGVREFHSLKRQTTYATWSLRELSDRNVIAELFQKLSISDENQAVFVSATTANELNELCERAERSQSLSAFGSQLDSSSALKTGFEQHILPHCDSDWKIGWNRLRRNCRSQRPCSSKYRRL